MADAGHLIKTYSSNEELGAYKNLERLFRSSPVGPGAALQNLGLFLTRASMSRILFLHDIYLKVLTVPGCVIDLGCHWGQNAALFSTFRNIYEPQNISRLVLGLDTFSDYLGASERDGGIMVDDVKKNPGALPDRYEATLDEILDCHDQLGARGHIKKHEVLKGDACETMAQYFEDHPDTLVSLIYFDIGLYAPTKKCLELVKDRLTKGSIIGLDHIAMPDVPGDGRAVMDVLGYRNCRLVRDPRVPYQAYIVVE